MTSPTPTSNPPATADSSRWPRVYLIQLYAAAIESGSIRIGPISEEAATSLRQSLYRFRRRKDSRSSDYIQPEFHLVTATAWADDHFYLIYDTLPEGEALPSFTAVPRDEATSSLPAPVTSAPALIDDIEPIDVHSFVHSIRKPKP